MAAIKQTKPRKGATAKGIRLGKRGLQQCSYCPLKFGRGAGMAAHIRSAHPNANPYAGKTGAPAATASKPKHRAAKQQPIARTIPGPTPLSYIERLDEMATDLTKRREAIDHELSQTRSIQQERQRIEDQLDGLAEARVLFMPAPETVPAETAAPAPQTLQAGG